MSRGIARGTGTSLAVQNRPHLRKHSPKWTNFMRWDNFMTADVEAFREPLSKRSEGVRGYAHEMPTFPFASLLTTAPAVTSVI